MLVVHVCSEVKNNCSTADCGRSLAVKDVAQGTLRGSDLPMYPNWWLTGQKTKILF